MKKYVVSVLMSGLLVFGLVLSACDNGSTSAPGGGGEPVKIFKLTGISDIQKETEVGPGGHLLYGIFPTGTDKEIVKRDSQRYFGLLGGDTEAVEAFVGGPYATILANGSSDDWWISSALQSTVSDPTLNWNGSGTFDAWFVLKTSGTGGTITAYKLADLVVPQGQATPIERDADDFAVVSPF
jgi:hypothetical protein